MALDDFVEPEVGIAVAVTAAVASPRVRGALRKGAVYTVAGLLKAGDMIKGFSRGVVNGAREAAAEAQEKAASAPESPGKRRKS